RGEALCLCAVFFFFQAEDGIRDWSVTGVQTCALPILAGGVVDHAARHGDGVFEHLVGNANLAQGMDAAHRQGQVDRPAALGPVRSEERRVGEEGGRRGGGGSWEKSTTGEVEGGVMASV